MNKRAISDIVSTVLIIMITFAAITIIGAVILPMIRTSFTGSNICSQALSDLYLDNLGAILVLIMIKVLFLLEL